MKILSYNKFNESTDPNIEIIKEAFYNFTDAYPLIDFRISTDHKMPNYYVVSINFSLDFCNSKTNYKLWKDINSKIEISESYLENDFEIYKNINTNYYNLISIRLFKK